MRHEVEIDSALAALYEQLGEVQSKFDLYATSAKTQAGSESYYQGKRLVYSMTLAEAEAILTKDVSYHADDTYGYTLVRKGYNINQLRRTLAGLKEYREKEAAIKYAMIELESKYTGWSRFFIVRNIGGHIHSSMSCHSCRPTTRFGWLPNLSGLSETDAVEAEGPHLCSHCFPTAPTDWTVGFKTKKEANASK